ncbi:glycoside hydrolase [Patescibacteria group bacterium]|nr:glycoside hydrolase [Patescibacteria group bacterium]
MENTLQICYQKSVALLKKNSDRHGISASSKSSKAKARNYLSVFGRDASICSLGMVVSSDRALIASARQSLDTLARYQADNGQIPYLVQTDKKQADFYYFGSVDSSLWWLIAIKFFDQNTRYNLEKKYKKQIQKAINWLQCQEHPNFYLLLQPEASDWADLMPRSGFVLYTNALWYWVKKLYNLSDADKTKKYFNYIFDKDFIAPKNEIRLIKLLASIKNKQNGPLYPSFVNRSFVGTEDDVFGNILAAMVGLSELKKSKQIVDYLKKHKANSPFPIKAVLKPIKKSDPMWRSYMDYLKQNKVDLYHNGGVWPFIGSFWVMLLVIIGDKQAIDQLQKLAELNQKNNWQFNEHFDGKTLKAMGMSGQSWNAATYILAYKFLNNN